MADASDTAVQQPSSSASSQASYQLLLPKIMAVENERTINIDFMAAILMVLGNQAGIRALRDDLKATLNDFDEAQFDLLPDATRAAQYAHGLYLQATKAPGPFQTLVDLGENMRDMLYADAVALSKRGFINIDSLREVKRTTGHRILIVDLQILYATFDQKLPELTGRTSVTREELDRVLSLIDTLSEAVGSKEHSQAAQAQATTIRIKAFSLLMDTYEEIQAGIDYVRRKHGDADKIAPSLYLTRSSGKRAPSNDPTEPAATGIHAVVDPAMVPAAAPAIAATGTGDLTATLAQNGPFKRGGGEE